MLNRAKGVINGVLQEKDLIKNTFIVGIATSISSLLAFLANLFLSRMFGPESFGTFKTVVYLGGLVTGLADLGISLTLIKYVAEFNAKKKKSVGALVTSLVKIRVIAYLVVIIGLVLTRNQLATYLLHDSSLSYLFIPLIFMVGASSFNFLSATVQGYENFQLFSFATIARNVVYLGLGLLLGHFFGISYVILAFGVSTLLANLLCVKYLVKKRIFQKDDDVNTKEIFLNYSLPLFVLSVPNYLTNAIVPVLSLFFSTELMGYYSFAFMFYFIPSIVSGSLSRVIFPKISKLNGLKKHVDAKKTLGRVFVLYTVFVILGVILTLFFSELFISLVAPAYLPGLILFKVLIIFGLFAGYGGILNFYLNARERLKEGSLVVLVVVVLLFLVSYLVMSSLG